MKQQQCCTSRNMSVDVACHLKEAFMGVDLLTITRSSNEHRRMIRNQQEQLSSSLIGGHGAPALIWFSQSTKHKQGAVRRVYELRDWGLSSGGFTFRRVGLANAGVSGFSPEPSVAVQTALSVRSLTTSFVPAGVQLPAMPKSHAMLSLSGL